VVGALGADVVRALKADVVRALGADVIGALGVDVVGALRVDVVRALGADVVEAFREGATAAGVVGVLREDVVFALNEVTVPVIEVHVPCAPASFPAWFNWLTSGPHWMCIARDTSFPRSAQSFHCNLQLHIHCRKFPRSRGHCNIYLEASAGHC
jgi:hypothetical protein